MLFERKKRPMKKSLSLNLWLTLIILCITFLPAQPMYASSQPVNELELLMGANGLVEYFPQLEARYTRQFSPEFSLGISFSLSNPILLQATGRYRLTSNMNVYALGEGAVGGGLMADIYPIRYFGGGTGLRQEYGEYEVELSTTAGLYEESPWHFNGNWHKYIKTQVEASKGLNEGQSLGVRVSAQQVHDSISYVMRRLYAGVFYSLRF